MSGKTTYLYFLNQLLLVEEHDLAEIALRLLPETPHRGRQLGLRTDFRLNRTHGPISAKRQKKTPGQQNIAKKRIDAVGVLVGLLCVRRACARVRLGRGQEPFLIFRRRALPEPKTIVKHQATVDHGIYT